MADNNEKNKRQFFASAYYNSGEIGTDMTYDDFINALKSNPNLIRKVYSGLEKAKADGKIRELAPLSVIEKGFGITTTTTPTTTTTDVVTEEETPQQGTPARTFPTPNELNPNRNYDSKLGGTMPIAERGAKSGKLQQVSTEWIPLPNTGGTRATSNQPQPVPEETQIAPIDQQSGQVQGGRPISGDVLANAPKQEFQWSGQAPTKPVVQPQTGMPQTREQGMQQGGINPVDLGVSTLGSFETSLIGGIGSELKGIAETGYSLDKKIVGALEGTPLEGGFVAPYSKPEDSWIYQAGQTLSDFAEKDLYINPKYQGGILDIVAQGGGSIAAIGLTGGLTPAGGIAKFGIKNALTNRQLIINGAKQFLSRQAIAGALMGVGQETDEARKLHRYANSVPKDEYVFNRVALGESEEDASKAYDKLKSVSEDEVASGMIPFALFSGATEAIPMERLFTRLGKASKDLFISAFKNGGIQGAEEFAQEAIQQTISNVGKGEVYNEAQRLTEGVVESGEAGGATGFVLGSILTALAGKRANIAKAVADGTMTKEEAIAELNDVNKAQTLVNDKLQALDNKLLLTEGASRIAGLLPERTETKPADKKPIPMGGSPLPSSGKTIVTPSPYEVANLPEAKDFFDKNSPSETNVINSMPTSVESTLDKIAEGDIAVSAESLHEAYKWINDSFKQVISNQAISDAEKGATLNLLSNMLTEIDRGNTYLQETEAMLSEGMDVGKFLPEQKGKPLPQGQAPKSTATPSISQAKAIREENKKKQAGTNVLPSSGQTIVTPAPATTEVATEAVTETPTGTTAEAEVVSETPVAGAEANPALADVESTAKALEGKSTASLEASLLSQIAGGRINGKSANQVISEAYHTAKAKPESERTSQETQLIAAVEELLTPKENAVQIESTAEDTGSTDAKADIERRRQDIISRKSTPQEKFDFLENIPEGTIFKNEDGDALIVRKKITKRGTESYELIPLFLNENDVWELNTAAVSIVEKKANGEFNINASLPQIFTSDIQIILPTDAAYDAELDALGSTPAKAESPAQQGQGEATAPEAKGEVETESSFLNSDTDLLGDEKSDAWMYTKEEYDKTADKDDRAILEVRIPTIDGGDKAQFEGLLYPKYNKNRTHFEAQIPDTPKNRQLLSDTKGKVVKKTESPAEFAKKYYDNQVRKAIENGKYQKAIAEGRMTADDAKAIIESAGLDVPQDILAQTKPTAETVATTTETTGQEGGEVVGGTTATEVTLTPVNATDVETITKIENATEKGRELALAKPVNKWVKRAFDTYEDISSRAKKAGIYDGKTLKIGGQEIELDTPAKFKAFLAQSQNNFDAINEAVKDIPSEQKTDTNPSPKTVEEKSKEVFNDAKSTFVFPIGLNPKFKFDSRLPENVVRFFKKYFRPRGLWTKGMFSAKRGMENQISAQVQKSEFLVRDLRNAVKEAYPKGVTQEQLQAMNDVLQGMPREIPANLYAPITKMREHIDELSEMMISEGIIDERLVPVFDANMGIYTTRTYAIHNDPKSWLNYIENEPEGQQIRNNAVNFVRQATEAKADRLDKFADENEKRAEKLFRRAELAEGDEALMLQAKADEVIARADRQRELARTMREQDFDAQIEAFLFAEGQPLDVVRKGNVGAKDLGVLKKRKNIPDAIRALMGEEKDPLTNYTMSVAKMSALIANNQFLNEVKAQGVADGLFTKTPKGKNIAEIASASTDSMSPLNGLYTTKDIAEAFKEFDANTKSPWYIDAMLWFNAVVKVNKTVLSQGTNIRNFISNPIIELANGYIPTLKGKAIDSQMEQILNRRFGDKEKLREYIIKLTELGVLGQGGNYRDILSVFEDLKGNKYDYQKLIEPKIRNAAKKTWNIAQKVYKGGDEFWKVVAFENERAVFEKAYGDTKTDEEIDQMTADKIRKTRIDYSMVPKVVKAINKYPFTGTFVTFPAEVLRIGFNIPAVAYEEMNSGNKVLREHGIKRMAGYLTAMTLPYGVKEFAKYLLGMDDEEEEARKKFLAPWAQNSTLIWIGKDRYIDTGFSDAFSILKKPIVAFSRGKSAAEGALSATKEFLGPVISEEIGYKTLKNVSDNTDEFGNPIYDENADAGTIYTQVSTYVLKQVEPGTVSQARRLYLGETGALSEKGQQYRTGDEVLNAVFGIKPVTINWDNAVSYKFRDAVEGINNSNKFFLKKSKELRKDDKEGRRKAAESTNLAVENAYNDLREYYTSALKIGMIPQKVVDIMKQSGVPKELMYAVVNNTGYKNYIIVLNDGTVIDRNTQRLLRGR